MEIQPGQQTGDVPNNRKYEGSPLFDEEKSFESITEAPDQPKGASRDPHAGGNGSDTKTTFLQALVNMFRGMVGLSFLTLPFACHEVDLGSRRSDGCSS